MKYIRIIVSIIIILFWGTFIYDEYKDANEMIKINIEQLEYIEKHPDILIEFPDIVENTEYKIRIGSFRKGVGLIMPILYCASFILILFMNKWRIRK